MRMTYGVAFGLLAAPALAVDLESKFSNIDGGTHQLSQWAGQPILVVNTASLCGFTGQYEDLQKLHDTYSDRGLVVLAVPSDDFAQELATGKEVKEFCAVNYNITLPMTDITPVVGEDAHPFYKSLAVETGFEPTWNFNKVLIGPDGKVTATFRAQTEPMSDDIVGPIKAMLEESGS